MPSEVCRHNSSSSDDDGDYVIITDIIVSGLVTAVDIFVAVLVRASGFVVVLIFSVLN